MSNRQEDINQMGQQTPPPNPETVTKQNPQKKPRNRFRIKHKFLLHLPFFVYLPLVPGLMLLGHFVGILSFNEIRVTEKATSTNPEITALQDQIKLIGEQQQNFIANGQGTLNVLLTVILTFAAYNAVKESFLNPEEKKQLKQDLNKEINVKINQRNDETKSNLITQLDKEIETKSQVLKSDLEKIVKQELGKVQTQLQTLQKDLKWLEYQTTALAAEQLQQNLDKNPYESLTTLYDRLRAIEILTELKSLKTQEQDQEKILELLNYEIGYVHHIYKILNTIEEKDRLSNNFPILTSRQVESINSKFLLLVHSINDDRKKNQLQHVGEEIEKILEKMNPKKYS